MPKPGRTTAAASPRTAAVSVGPHLEHGSGWWSRMGQQLRELEIARSAFRLSCAFAVLAGSAALLNRMERSVQEMDHFRQRPSLTYSTPGWMPQDWLDGVHQQIGRTADGPLGNPDLVPAIARDLANSPWVARVNEVRKQANGTVTVDCEFRRPVALVRSGQSFYLVDREAVVLRRVRSDELSRLTGPGEGMMVIWGVQQPVPGLGDTWTGRDLRASLALVTDLASQPFRHQIMSVDASNYDNRISAARPQLVLLTTRNTWINWGRAPGEEAGLENGADRKMALLRAVYHTHGTVDHGANYISVQFNPDKVTLYMGESGRSSLRG